MKVLISIFILLAYSLSASAQSIGNASIAPGESILFQKEDGISCYRIPSLIRAANGDLIALADQRVPSCADLIGNPDINIVGRKSRDGGKSWTPIKKIIDFPEGESASDASMILDKETGTLFLFYNYMNHHISQEFRMHVCQSTDHGETWSAPEDITEQICKEEWKGDFKFITSGKGIQTQEGILLHTLVHLKNGVYVFGSRDHGQSWFFKDIAIQPADESKIIELEDRRLMINSRVNHQSCRHIHLSQDGGESWSSYPDRQLIDPHCNASIIRTRKDTLYFCNLKNEQDRSHLYLRRSVDAGRNWEEGEPIYSGSAAYSDICEVEEGKIIGILYEKDDYSCISIRLHAIR